MSCPNKPLLRPVILTAKPIADKSQFSCLSFLTNYILQVPILNLERRDPEEK